MKLEEKMKIFQFLEENQYLQYGTVIPRNVLEIIFKAKLEDGWDYLGPYLAIKTFLEEEGYMCTNENQKPGDLKIYEADQVATQVNRMVVNTFKRLRRAQRCMTNVRMENLDYPDMKKHLHENNKLQSILYSIKDKLKELE